MWVDSFTVKLIVLIQISRKLGTTRVHFPPSGPDLRRKTFFMLVPLSTLNYNKWDQSCKPTQVLKNYVCDDLYFEY